MGFKPDKLHVNGEIHVTLSNGRIAAGQIEFNEGGEVVLRFTEPDMVARWLMLTLESNLVGLQIVTQTKETSDLLEPPVTRNVLEEDSLVTKESGEVVWLHHCKVGGFTVLPHSQGSCPNCGNIQLTRRKQP